LLDQPEFTNAVLEHESPMSPVELLLACKRIELMLGRDPHGVHFGPRVIDLDLLAIPGQCVGDPDHDLVVPHPRLAERRFVLEPLAELEPELQPWAGCLEDPRATWTVRGLLATPDVASQDVERIAEADWLPDQAGGASRNRESGGVG